MTPAQDRVVHITPMQSYRIAPSPHHLQPGAGEILKSWRADPVVWMSGCRDASFPALLVCCSEPRQFIASNTGRREYSSLRRFYPPGYMAVTADGIRHAVRSGVDVLVCVPASPTGIQTISIRTLAPAIRLPAVTVRTRPSAIHLIDITVVTLTPAIPPVTINR